MRDAPVAEVEDAIRPGGLAPTKAVRIQAILRDLGDDDLCSLTTEPLDEARAQLCELPGVGRKTAACVLLFALGMRDVPVDTHVSRVGTRLACSAQARRSRSSTTRCSRSRRPARS